MRTPNTISTSTNEGMPISDAAKRKLVESTKDALNVCAQKIGKAIKKAELPDEMLYCVPFIVTNNVDCRDEVHASSPVNTNPARSEGREVAPTGLAQLAFLLVL